MFSNKYFGQYSNLKLNIQLINKKNKFDNKYDNDLWILTNLMKKLNSTLKDSINDKIEHNQLIIGIREIYIIKEKEREIKLINKIKKIN